MSVLNAGVLRRVLTGYVDSLLDRADAFLREHTDTLRVHEFERLRVLEWSLEQQRSDFASGVGVYTPEYRALLRFTEEEVRELRVSLGLPATIEEAREQERRERTVRGTTR